MISTDVPQFNFSVHVPSIHNDSILLKLQDSKTINPKILQTWHYTYNKIFPFPRPMYLNGIALIVTQDYALDPI